MRGQKGRGGGLRAEEVRVTNLQSGSRFHISTRNTAPVDVSISCLDSEIDQSRFQFHISTWNRPVEVSMSCLNSLESANWCLSFMSRDSESTSQGLNFMSPNAEPTDQCLNFMSWDSVSTWLGSQFHVSRLVSTSWCLNFMSWFRVDRLMSQFHVSTRNRHVTNTLCGRAGGRACGEPKPKSRSWSRSQKIA